MSNVKTENPLIDRVNDLISSLIDSRYEDTRQQAWVEILSQGPNDEEGILATIRKIRQKALNKHITEKHKFSSLDKQIGQDPDYSASLIDFIGQEDPNIARIEDSVHIVKCRVAKTKKRKYVNLREAAHILGMKYSALLYRVKRGLLPVQRVSKRSHAYWFSLEDVQNLKRQIESKGIKVGDRLGVAQLRMIS